MATGQPFFRTVFEVQNGKKSDGFGSQSFRHAVHNLMPLLRVLRHSISAFLSEVFNVGTTLFLFISGFLYGEKKVGSYPKWFYRRIKRICIPMYIYMASVFVYRVIFVTHTAEPFKYLLYALNLQGICFVYLRFDYSLFSVKGTDHLWFLTVIMMCYLLVPLLSRLRPFFAGFIKPPPREYLLSCCRHRRHCFIQG